MKKEALQKREEWGYCYYFYVTLNVQCVTKLNFLIIIMKFSEYEKVYIK